MEFQRESHDCMLERPEVFINRTEITCQLSLSSPMMFRFCFAFVSVLVQCGSPPAFVLSKDSFCFIQFNRHLKNYGLARAYNFVKNSNIFNKSHNVTGIDEKKLQKNHT